MFKILVNMHKKQKRKNTKINKLVIKGLLFGVHNAKMTVLFGNVTDTDTENVTEQHKGYIHYLRKEVFER